MLNYFQYKFANNLFSLAEYVVQEIELNYKFVPDISKGNMNFVL